jgi:hypothetical protein
MRIASLRSGDQPIITGMQEAMRIELPPPPRKIYVVTSLVFAVVAITNVLVLLWHRRPVSGSEMRVRILEAIVFGTFSVVSFARYAVRHFVEINDGVFKIVKHTLGLKLTRKLSLAEISHLRFTPYSNDRRRGVLSFDRRGRTRWLPMVEPAIGSDALLAQVHSQFPNLSVRQKVLNVH